MWMPQSMAGSDTMTWIRRALRAALSVPTPSALGPSPERGPPVAAPAHEPTVQATASATAAPGPALCRMVSSGGRGYGVSGRSPDRTQTRRVCISAPLLRCGDVPPAVHPAWMGRSRLVTLSRCVTLRTPHGHHSDTHCPHTQPHLTVRSCAALDLGFGCGKVQPKGRSSLGLSLTPQDEWPSSTPRFILH